VEVENNLGLPWVHPMDNAQEKYGQSTIEITPATTSKSPSVNLQQEGKGIKYKVLSLDNYLGIQIARSSETSTLFIFGKAKMASIVIRKILGEAK